MQAGVELANAPDKYLNQWVAVEDSTSVIIGHGDSLEEAEREAQETGEDFFLIFLTPCAGGFLL